MIGSALVLQGDALSLPLPDASVDLIVTSPPYFALRSYRDGDEHYAGQIGSEATPGEFLEALWAATREMVRVLKPTGSIFVNLGDKYAGSGGHNNANIGAKKDRGPGRYNQASGGVPAKSLMGLPWRYAIGCIDDLGLILRAEIVWDKPNGLPESVTDRVRRSHETWFHLTRQGRYFSAVDEVREAHAQRTYDQHEIDKRAGLGASVSGFAGDRQNGLRVRSSTPEPNPLGKLPGSVWRIPSEPLLIPEAALARLDLPDHFAAFPQEWPRRLILGWSPSGICVECGEGRRPVVAKTLIERCANANPKRYISVDLSHDYGRLARWRIFESGHQAKTTARFWRERQESLL